MIRLFKVVLLASAILLMASMPASAATFQTQSAQLTAGEKVSSLSRKNGNRTSFIFSNITTNPNTKKQAAFLQWAPLMPRAKNYKNGLLVDSGDSVRLWINGIWYWISFDGESITIK